MQIILNNRPEELLNPNPSIQDLLKEKNFTFKMLVVKINDRLVKKEDFKTTQIREGDEVMVLHLISGG